MRNIFVVKVSNKNEIIVSQLKQKYFFILKPDGRTNRQT